MNSKSTCLAILLWATGLCASAQLVENGQSDYVIYSSPAATETEQFAARELQKYIAQISDCELPIVQNTAGHAKVIYVGFEDVPPAVLGDLTPASFGPEEYIIQRAGNALLIAGGVPRGTLYGVVGLLRDHFGCRWYTPTFSKIPKQPTLRVDGLPDRQSPAFAYREPWYREAYDTEFAVHNRLNPSIVPIPENKGGSFIIYPFAHTFNNLVPVDRYFEEHPEYFSLVDGERQGKHTGAQLCLTNPEVVRIATDNVLNWIAEHPEVNVFSVDQNDGYGYCECESCAALDAAEESHAGTILHFVNQIADVVAERHPDVRLQTFAYVYSEAPPKTIRPRPNVTVRLCHYEYCQAHAIGQCDDHLLFVERLEGWSKITDSITIWDYFTDFRHYLVPYPNFESVVNHPRFYADRNCIGLFAQGNNVRAHGGGEFSSLRAWVFAQLMWDPYQDGWSLINEYVENVYGPAAPYIAEYIRTAHDAVKPKEMKFSIFSPPYQMDFLTPEFLERAEDLFRKAEAACQGDAALLKRVQLAHLPIHYTRLYFFTIGGTAYLDPSEMPVVLEAFARIVEEHEITQLSEQGDKDEIAEFIQSAANAPAYVTDWRIMGPFENPDRSGFDKVYAPEREFDVDMTCTGINGQKLRWTGTENGRIGYVDLTKLMPGIEEGVAYAYREFEADADTEMIVELGSNDGIKLWLNGDLLLTSKASRTARPGDETVSLALKKGTNSVLLKIDQLGGGWGFYFSVK